MSLVRADIKEHFRLLRTYLISKCPTSPPDKGDLGGFSYEKCYWTIR